MVNSELTSIQPKYCATVSASAGTGKTWLLVSRMIRLLLDGVNPGSILAITFTRKAAAEMQARLNERLQTMASCEQKELITLLRQIDAPAHSDTINKARQLFENVLHSTQPPRITTFHAFCQDLLRRFPFEANVPPGFELVEQTSALQSEAMDLLFTDATHDTNSTLATALETLFDYCNGIANTKLALQSFMHHRSDWWAYTLDQADPVAYATNYIRQQLDVNETQDPLVNFFTTTNISSLKEFSALLAKNPTKTNIGSTQKIADAFVQINHHQIDDAFNHIYSVFFTSKDEPRTRSPSKTLKKSMGESGETRFIELHEFFCTAIQRIVEIRAKVASLQLSSAWYKAGHHLLQHYQSLKIEQRLLDFSDLEWSAYLLLTQKHNATWVQFKLDARIDHILVDEFQDTNPTQWQLLLPLLQELAADNSQTQRSVFLVGDSKQSIYRFRRAQPGLLKIAQQWLNKNLSAQSSTLSWSRRSSPAIIEFVNHVFSSGDFLHRIVDFQPHQTHLKDLWGRVTVVPLFNNAMETETDTESVPATSPLFRNPLHEPRLVAEDIRHRNEAHYIASEITRLIDAAIVVNNESAARTISYNDIIILLRHRTHAAIYQQALTESGIPYIGIEKGTLLDTLEIRDIVALLSLLTTPFNNLALAQVLKSPIFDCTDQDLIVIANTNEGYWIDRLEHLTEQQPVNNKIIRAFRLLKEWRTKANTLPVHDLLDSIFCDCNLIERYVAAYPTHLTHRVESNLTRFMELALEIDSGRYPSIGKFLSRLQSLKASDNEAPDEFPAGRSEQRVRLLTIHAAKGLEAPVIFLADATNTTSPNDAYRALVKWPAIDAAPNCFSIIPNKSNRDSFTHQQLAEQQIDQQREEANLFYVAITRARQLLYITGVQPNKQGNAANWHQTVMTQLQLHADNYQVREDGTWANEHNTMPHAAITPPVLESQSSIAIDANLSKPITHINLIQDVVPSNIPLEAVSHVTSNNSNNIQTVNDLRQRGIVLHRMLQLISEQPNAPEKREKIKSSFSSQINQNEISLLWDEAQALIQQNALAYIYDPDRFDVAYNEVPIYYNLPGYHVHGVVDRVVITEDTVYIVDYKTQLTTDRSTQSEIASNYIPQMSLYCHGAKLLWPGKDVKAQILFTRNANMVNIDTVSVEKAITTN